MKERDRFSGVHPLVNFLYFGLVLGFTMASLHPVLLACSLAGALAYAAYLRKTGAAPGLPWAWALAAPVLAALVNMAFSHRGMTILTYLPSGNPLTAESILFGLAAGAMLAAALVWFACYNAVMTSDKFVWLFGRVIPALSLVLSMTLRFVPKFRAQLRSVREARRGLDGGEGEQSVLRRARRGVTELSILVTWSLENAIETADSMRARGYGLPGRTAYSVYTLDSRDKAALAWLLFAGAYVLFGHLAGGLSWQYYPAVAAGAVTPLGLSFVLVWLLLCLTPVLFDRWEDRRWTRLMGKGAGA